MFAGMPLVFMDIEVAQGLAYRGSRLATTILLGSRCPTARARGFHRPEPDEVATDAMRPLDGAISSINLTRILLWFVAAMIIGTMIYLSALERRRDVAVLKAVGGSTVQLGSSIALQGVLTALAAAPSPRCCSSLLVPIFPLEVTVPDPRARAGAADRGAGVAAVGGVGLRKAVGTDPALAFAGPGS
jgi:putative ABC transport system permease protein